MSLRRTVRAFPTLLRIGVAEAVAYRAEMIIWVLATTMPLIMMALWTSVAREGPVGRFGPKDFTAYFLATFVARQLTGSWIAWQMNMDVRQGTLSMRLLRPVHPIAAYAAEVLAALPLRVLIAVPIALVLLLSAARDALTRDPLLWLAWLVAIAGGWLLTYFVNVIIGSLAFFLGSSGKMMEIYFALFFVFGGYTVPVELFPGWLRAINDWLPFRYQVAASVEVLTGRFDRAGVLQLLGQQWLCILIIGGTALALWNRGVRRFAAFGG